MIHNEPAVRGSRSSVAQDARDARFREQVLTAHTDGMIGKRIGPYRVVRLIAHGGMGSVYLAERADEQFEKPVAIKFVRSELTGVVSDEALRRFHNERQVLASLTHPNIAHLLDGGATDDGMQYLVMEYVVGTRIDNYCDQHKLTIEFTNDLYKDGEYDRNLFIHAIAVKKAR
jgi:serine/threonine protein kinase